MEFDVSALRKDTDEDKFPYDDRAVTFIHVDNSGRVTADHTKTGKIAILNDWRAGELLVATWTGSRRSDTFSVDVAAARRALLQVQGTARRQARRQSLGPRQLGLAREMYDETGPDGKRRYTVQEIADEFGVARTTIYRYLDTARPSRFPTQGTQPVPD